MPVGVILQRGVGARQRRVKGVGQDDAFAANVEIRRQLLAQDPALHRATRFSIISEYLKPVTRVSNFQYTVARINL